MFFFKNTTSAQNVVATGSLDRDSVAVGQPFNYELSLQIPKDYLIEWTDFRDTISSQVEILGKSEIEKTPIGSTDKLLMRQTLTLASFETGDIEIPEIGLVYHKDQADTTKSTVYTNPSYIYIVPTEIDTTAVFRPIKEPIKQHITAQEVFPWVGIAIALALITLLIIRLSSRKNKVETEVEEKKPLIPAIITAREKMGLLKEKNLWQEGKVKEYYTDLTDIAREYLEGQFSIDAVEMTSDEILEEVKAIRLEDRTLGKLRETLTMADLVKFAKAFPTPSDNETSFSNVNAFIEESYEFFQAEEKRKAEEEKTKKLIKTEEVAS